MKCIIRYIESRKAWQIYEFDDEEQVVLEWAGGPWRSQAVAERAIVVESMARGLNRYEWTIEK